MNKLELLLVPLGALAGSPIVAATLNQAANLEIPPLGAVTVGGFIGLFVLAGRVGRWTGRVDERLSRIELDVGDLKTQRTQDPGSAGSASGSGSGSG